MARRSLSAQSRRRVIFYGPLLVLVYLAIVGRVVFLQTVAAPDLQVRATQDRKDRTELPAERGRILDRNGQVLAFNVEESKIVLHPRLIRDKKKAAEVLSKHVGILEKEIYHILTTRKNYVVLAESVPVEDGIRLRQELLALGPSPGINGVEVQHISRRIYPLGTVGSKLIGAINSNGEGIAGVERYADEQLKGRPGELWADFDRNGRPIPTRMRKTIPAVPGRDIVLTIDSRIQFAAQQALEKQVKAFSAESGHVIVMDPQTGEILALAEYPGFDPNNIRRQDVDHMASSSVIHFYEPGSTLKLFTAAAALERGLTNVTTQCTGTIQVGNATVRCPCSISRTDPRSAVNISRMLQYSCNSEAIALGRRIGSGNLYEEFKKFGLLDRMDVPGYGRTVGGMLPDPGEFSWSAMRLANVSFGQGIATSRLNLTAAYAAVANGGFLMSPQLIREIRSPEGNVEKPFRKKTVHRVISDEHARTLKNYLHNVVENGTGRNAAVEGIAVGGKTGSAQMAREGGGGFIPNAFVTSFCGIAPVGNPRVAILVTVEKPKGSTHGSAVAAPVFREVAENALWRLGEAPARRRVSPDTETTGQETSPVSDSAGSQGAVEDRVAKFLGGRA